MGALVILLLLVLLGVVWLWPVFVASRIGARKGRENAWFWGFALGWVGVLVLASAPELAAIPPMSGYVRLPAEGERLPQSSQIKICPKCAERVRAPALVCRFCRHIFSE